MTVRTLRIALHRILTPPLVIVAAAWMLLEEVLWVRLAALVARLERHPAVARFEARLARLPPYVAMTLFAVPTALLVPFKLFGVYLIATRHALLGVALIAVAKVSITAMVARLFALCRPQLMSVRWFARLHDWLLRWRDDLYRRVRAMPGWQRAHTILRTAGGLLRRLMAELGLRRRVS